MPTTEPTIRRHDAAVYNWLGGLKIDYGEVSGKQLPNHPILRRFASPQRAWASIVDLLVQQDWIDGNDAKSMRENAGDFSVLPLPVATVERSGPTPDTQLSRVPVKFRQSYLNPSTGKWEILRHPGHYRINYTITFWMLKRYTEEWIDDWLLGQFGNVGAGQNEIFLTVQHTDPWKKKSQSFKWEGKQDLSDLEGDEQRYLRIQHTFSLRTWAMLPSTASHAPIETVVNDFEKMKTLGTVGETEDDFDTTAPAQSMNLFPWAGAFTDFSNWKVENNATVDYEAISPNGIPPASNPALVFDLPGDGDTATLLEYLTHLHDDGYGIVSFAFRYTSDAPALLEVDQADDAEPSTTKETVARVELPPSPGAWQHFHRFFLVNKKAFFSRVRGSVYGPSSVKFFNTDIRNIADGEKRAYTGASSGGGQINLTWSHLESKNHLMVAVVGSSGTITLRDDPQSPQHTKSRDVDPSAEVGFVGLIQPAESELEMELNNTGSPSRVYRMTFDAPYKGHTLA